MLTRRLFFASGFLLGGLALSSFAQSTASADLAKFVPGKWTTANGRAAIEIKSLTDGVATGTWLDITGIIYPIGATWAQGKSASARFENQVLHMVLPTGNKLELRLSSDGTTLSGSRQLLSGNAGPGDTQVTFKRN